MRSTYPRRAANVLKDRASAYASYLAGERLDGLHQGPIDLQGESTRTRLYEVASVISMFYPADGIPDDPILAEDRFRFTRLYGRLAEALDRLDAKDSPDAPPEARRGTEAKRYRWHLRVEGRNRAAVKRAKALQGYVYQVCGIDFATEYGIWDGARSMRITSNR